MTVGVLLAGGAARRFGADKLLAAMPDGRAVAQASAEAMVRALGNVVAVVRPYSQRLSQTLVSAGCRVVECPGAEHGMGASIACGVSTSRDAGGWVIGLADMPAVASETIARVAAMLTSDDAIAAPVYRGERGHPVGFGGSYAEALAALEGDEGARRIVRANGGSLQIFDTDDPGVLLDIDTPKDLERLQ